MDKTRRKQLDRARRLGQRSELSHWSPVSLRGWRLTTGTVFPVTIRRPAMATAQPDASKVLSKVLTDGLPVLVYTGDEPWPLLAGRRAA